MQNHGEELFTKENMQFFKEVCDDLERELITHENAPEELIRDYLKKYPDVLPLIKNETIKQEYNKKKILDFYNVNRDLHKYTTPSQKTNLNKQKKYNIDF